MSQQEPHSPPADDPRDTKRPRIEDPHPTPTPPPPLPPVTKEDVFQAVRNGNFEEVSSLVARLKQEQPLEKVAELLNSEDDGRSLLCHALPHPQIVAWLLSDDGGRAAGFSNILWRLVETGSNVFLISVRRYTQSMIELAKGTKVENGERQTLLNAVDNLGFTALHAAAWAGNLSAIRWLLSSEEGGGRTMGYTHSVLTKSHRGATANLIAIRGHFHLCFESIIVDGCAEGSGDREKLLNDIAEHDTTLLHFAALNGSDGVISWLLSDEHGRRHGFKNVLNRTDIFTNALMIAVTFRGVTTCRAIAMGCKEENGEREEMLNALDSQRASILHLALGLLIPGSTDRLPTVEWLLDPRPGGAISLGFRRDHLFGVTNTLQSTLCLACRAGRIDMVVALVGECRNMQERLSLFMKVEIHGWTILHVAARFRHPELIAFLLRTYPEEMQLIVDMRDERGLTALQRAVMGEYDGTSFEWTLDEELTDDGSVPRYVANPAVIRALLGLGPQNAQGGVVDAAVEEDENNKEKKKKKEDEVETVSVARVNVNLPWKYPE